MSKSEFIRLLIQRGHLPKYSSGKTADLEGVATTMWTPKDVKCPKDDSHIITRSTHRYYCYDCGVYWEDR